MPCSSTALAGLGSLASRSRLQTAGFPKAAPRPNCFRPFYAPSQPVAPSSSTLITCSAHSCLTNSPPINTFRDWVYQTPAGWAALFLLLLGGGWLLLSGRRLGPPLEVPTQGRRREAAEFVVAMAGLQRRARVRDHIARQQSYRLKQALGRPWRLRPSLPDDEFLRQLQSLDQTLSRSAHHVGPIQDNSAAEARSHLTIEQVAAILDELATVPDEERLLQLARRVDEFRAAYGDSNLA